METSKSELEFSNSKIEITESNSLNIKSSLTEINDLNTELTKSNIESTNLKESSNITILNSNIYGLDLTNKNTNITCYNTINIILISIIKRQIFIEGETF